MGTIRQFDKREELVTFLERWLGYAKRGEITAIAVAATGSDMSSRTGFYFGPTGNIWMLVGSIEDLKFRLVFDGVNRELEEPKNGNDDKT